MLKILRNIYQCAGVLLKLSLPTYCYNVDSSFYKSYGLKDIEERYFIDFYLICLNLSLVLLFDFKA